MFKFVTIEATIKDLKTLTTRPLHRRAGPYNQVMLTLVDPPP